MSAVTVCAEKRFRKTAQLSLVAMLQLPTQDGPETWMGQAAAALRWLN
jgi:hypothetical protein